MRFSVKDFAPGGQYFGKSPDEVQKQIEQQTQALQKPQPTEQPTHVTDVDTGVVKLNPQLYQPDRPAKVIVTSGLYYRQPDGKVRSYPCQFVRHIQSREEPLSRTIIVGEEWVDVEQYWVREIGYLSFRNNGGKPFQVIPTKEQMAEAWSRAIELGFFHKPTNMLLPMKWLIHPGECTQGKPLHNEDIRMCVRCQHGETSLTITLIPN